MTEIAVIGGGIIGLAAAEELARNGHHVTVFERDGLGESCAAAAAAGMLAPAAEVDATPPATTRLAIESHRRFPAWVERLRSASGLDVGFDQTGTVMVALDADDLRELVHHEEAQRRAGFETRRLSREDVRALQPSVGPAVVGGLLLPHDWQVDPRQLLAALAVALRSAGGVLRERTPVEALERQNGAWQLRLPGGETVTARRVVVAAGAWTPGLLPAGARLPIRPVRGTVVRLAAPLESRAVVRTPRAYIVPRADCTLLGATVEERGWAREALAGGVFELLKEGRRAIPAIDEMAIAELAVGFRPGIRDGVPTIGALDEERTLIVASGHYRKGVELAPLTAELVRAAVEGAPEPMLRHTDPRRFEGG
ncbi:MAG: glycine oxidase ThiO [Chloroflexota bacterium]|nr:glycine oxidase ThiO [Chloroflexota bacterium]